MAQTRQKRNNLLYILMSIHASAKFCLDVDSELVHFAVFSLKQAGENGRRVRRKKKLVVA